jgi:hypothetical protein
LETDSVGKSLQELALGDGEVDSLDGVIFGALLVQAGLVIAQRSVSNKYEPEPNSVNCSHRIVSRKTSTAATKICAWKAAPAGCYDQ